MCLIAVLIIFTIFLSRHHQSGVYSDPSSIAVMASLLNHPDVLQDFKRLDASNKELEQAVKTQTYKLTHYQAEDEGMKYGIVPTVKAIVPDTGNGGAYTILANTEGGIDFRSLHQGLFTRRLFRTLGDISLAFLLLGIFGITLGYYLDVGSDGFNVFNSDSFGPRFILAFAGGIAVSRWKRLEKVRLPHSDLSMLHFFYPFRLPIIQETNLDAMIRSPHTPTLPPPTFIQLLVTSQHHPLDVTIHSLLHASACHRALRALHRSHSLRLHPLRDPRQHGSHSPLTARTNTRWPSSPEPYATIHHPQPAKSSPSSVAAVTWRRRTTPHLDRDPDSAHGRLGAPRRQHRPWGLGRHGRALRAAARTWSGAVLGVEQALLARRRLASSDGVVRVGIHCDAGA